MNKQLPHEEVTFGGPSHINKNQVLRDEIIATYVAIDNEIFWSIWYLSEKLQEVQKGKGGKSRSEG